MEIEPAKELPKSALEAPVQPTQAPKKVVPIVEPIRRWDTQSNNYTVQSVQIDVLPLQEIETFNGQSFQELIDERIAENPFFILAQVTTQVGEFTSYSYYDAYSLLQYIQKSKFLFNPIDVKSSTDPVSKQPILGIKFFEVDQKQPNANYIGSDYDVFTTSNEEARKKRKTSVKATLKANLPTDFMQDKDADLKTKIMAQGFVADSLEEKKGIAAVNYFEKLSQQTINLPQRARALINMAIKYYRGDIEGKNYAKARVYAEQAAQQDVDISAQATAKYLLARIYYFGHGVDKDFQKARALFNQVIESASGGANTQSNAVVFLGRIFYYGHGVNVDYEKAAFYFDQARNIKNVPESVKKETEDYLNKIQAEKQTPKRIVEEPAADQPPKKRLKEEE
jgi:tetratricopeptide (TPR) repeat protein